MNRKFRFLAIVALLLAVVMLLAACKDKDGNETLSIAGDYDAAQIEAKLNELKTDGIYVKLKITGQSDGEAAETEYYAYGAKGEIYYFMYGEDDDQVYIDLSDATCFTVYSCEKNNGSLAWTKTTTHYTQELNKETMKQQAEAMAAGVWSWFGYYANATGEGTKTTATMLGRTCDKYVMKQSAVTLGAAGKVDCEYWIDQATGVCLKYAVSGTAVTGEGTTSGSFAMEATEFRTNWTPALPAAATTVIDGTTQGSTGGGTTGGNTSGESTSGGGTSGSGTSGGNTSGEDTAGGGTSGSGTSGGNTSGESTSGGQGENELETSAFVNKRLAVTEVFTDDQYKALFEGAHIDFFTNGNFEFVSGLGVIIGTYEEIAQYNRVILNAYLIYKDSKYSYILPDGINASFIVAYGNPAYLWRIGDVEVEPATYAVVSLYLAESQDSPSAEDIPNDPNGRIAPSNFDAYQITQEVWDGIFKGDWLFEEYGNFRVDYSTSNGISPVHGIFMVDDDFINDDDLIIHVRQTYEKDGNGQYTFREYYYNGGVWQYYGEGYFDLADWWDRFTGAIPAPFMMSSYNSLNHNYFISTFKYTPEGESEITITNFRAWFENGFLQRVQFTKNGETYTYEFSDYDSVTIEDPAA